MSGFSSEWLALREPIDHAARSEEVISALRHYFLNDWKLVVTDIGSGTGSTIRALRPILSQDLTWHLIDYDDTLLSEARKHAEGGRIIFTELDLSKNLAPIFKPAPDLLTTSAFLDLVSLQWLKTFVKEVTIREIPFSIKLFEDAGYIVCKAKSDWKANADHKEFQRQLLDGWRKASSEINPLSQKVFDLWFEDRLALINDNESSVLVGHKDFLAVPPERRMAD